MAKVNVKKLVVPKTEWSFGDLFHLSLNGALEGLWTPGEQAGFDTPGEQEDSTWAYPEPPMQAVCVAPTLEGCFLGVFPNVAKFFEVGKVPYLNFYVYRPKLTGKERIVSPQVLTNERLVWDAHVTGEWRILDPVEMRMVGIIQVRNTNRSPTRMTHPFNDSSLPLESVGPQDIHIRRLK
jgi:hypothetical protein